MEDHHGHAVREEAKSCGSVCDARKACTKNPVVRQSKRGTSLFTSGAKAKLFRKHPTFLSCAVLACVFACSTFNLLLVEHRTHAANYVTRPPRTRSMVRRDTRATNSASALLHAFRS